MKTITVTNLNDSGTGSLRQAIKDAQNYTSTEEVEIVFEESLVGSISLGSNLTISAKTTVRLPQSVQLQLGGDILIYGAFIADNETSADALYSASWSAEVRVYSGGRLELTRANIVLTNASAMLTIDSGAVADLRDCEVSCYVTNTGELSAENSTFNSYVRHDMSTGTLKGKGNRFTKNETLRLTNISGNTSDVLGFIGTVTADAYIGLSGYMFTCALADVTATVAQGYKLTSSVTVKREHTAALAEGVSLELNQYSIGVYGTLKAENKTRKAVITDVAGPAGLYVYYCGKLDFTKADIELTNSSSFVQINSGGEANLNDCAVKGYVENDGSLYAVNSTFHSHIRLNSTTWSIAGSGNEFTQPEAFLLQSGFGGDTSFMKTFVKTAPEAAYVGMRGYMYDCTLADVRSVFSGGYKFLDTTEIRSGYTMTLLEGALIDDNYENFYIYGTLKAEFENVTDAIRGSSYIKVDDGGKVILKNANVVGCDGYTALIEAHDTGSSWTMECGSLAGGIRAFYGATVALTNVIYTSGCISCREDSYINLDGVTITGNGYISSYGTMTIKNTCADSAIYLNNDSSTVLENVTCGTLYIYEIKSLSTSGSGVTLTSQSALVVYDLSGDLLSSFAWNATAEDAYVRIQGNITDCTLSDISSKCAGGYRIDYGYVYGNVELESGVCIASLSNLNVYGTFKVENQTLQNVMNPEYRKGYVTIYDGGTVIFKNSNVSLNAIRVYSGGSLDMTGGAMNAVLEVDEGAAAQLDSVRCELSVSVEGSLASDSCVFDETISLYSGAELSGADNIFANEEVFQIKDADGDVAELVSQLENSQYAKDNPYVSIASFTDGCDVTLNALSGGLKKYVIQRDSADYYGAIPHIDADGVLNIGTGAVVVAKEMECEGSINCEAGAVFDTSGLVLKGTLNCNRRVFDGQLLLGAGALLCGNGNTIAADMRFVLSDWSGDVADTFAGLANTVLEEGMPAISVQSVSGAAVFGRINNQDTIYVLETSNLEVDLVVQDGVTLRCSVDDVYVYGHLSLSGLVKLETLKGRVSGYYGDGGVRRGMYISYSADLSYDTLVVDGTLMLNAEAAVSGDELILMGKAALGVVVTDWDGSAPGVMANLGNVVTTRDDAILLYQIDGLGGNTVTISKESQLSLTGDVFASVLFDEVLLYEGDILTIGADAPVTVGTLLQVQEGATLNLQSGARLKVEQESQSSDDYYYEGSGPVVGIQVCENSTVNLGGKVYIDGDVHIWPGAEINGGELVLMGDSRIVLHDWSGSTSILDSMVSGKISYENSTPNPVEISFGYSEGGSVTLAELKNGQTDYYCGNVNSYGTSLILEEGVSLHFDEYMDLYSYGEMEDAMPTLTMKKGSSISGSGENADLSLNQGLSGIDCTINATLCLDGILSGQGIKLTAERAVEFNYHVEGAETYGPVYSFEEMFGNADYECTHENAYAVCWLSTAYGTDAVYNIDAAFMAAHTPVGCKQLVFSGYTSDVLFRVDSGITLGIEELDLSGNSRVEFGKDCVVVGYDRNRAAYLDVLHNSEIVADNTTFQVTLGIDGTTLLKGSGYRFAAKNAVNYWCDMSLQSLADVKHALDGVDYTVLRDDAIFGLSLSLAGADDFYLTQNDLDALAPAGFASVALVGDFSSGEFMGEEVVLDGVTILPYSMIGGHGAYLLPSLKILNCTLNGDVYISGWGIGNLVIDNAQLNGAEIDASAENTTISNCSGTGVLSIRGPITIRNCDLSQIEIEFSDWIETAGTVDLSGNYWGTTDIEAIRSYFESAPSGLEVVIDDVLAEPPAGVGFTFAASISSGLKLEPSEKALTLAFTAQIDADSAGMGAVVLRDAAGRVLEIDSIQVKGDRLVLNLAEPLEIGEYTVRVNAGLKDTDGNAFVAPVVNPELKVTVEKDSQVRVLKTLFNESVGSLDSVDIYLVGSSVVDPELLVEAVSLVAEDGTVYDAVRVETGIDGLLYRAIFDGKQPTGQYDFVIKDDVAITSRGDKLGSSFQQTLYISSPDLTARASFREYELNYSGPRTNEVTVSYVVENSGDPIKNRNRVDTLYVCEGPKWDPATARVVAWASYCDAFELGESRELQLNLPLTGLSPYKDYYLFVAVDSKNDIKETNESDNVAQVGIIRSEISEIKYGVNSLHTDSANHIIYYQYEADATGIVTLGLEHTGTVVSVYESGEPSKRIALFNNINPHLLFKVEEGKKYYIEIAPRAKIQSEVCLSRVEALSGETKYCTGTQLFSYISNEWGSLQLDFSEEGVDCFVYDALTGHKVEVDKLSEQGRYEFACQKNGQYFISVASEKDGSVTVSEIPSAVIELYDEVVLEQLEVNAGDNIVFIFSPGKSGFVFFSCYGVSADIRVENARNPEQEVNFTGWEGTVEWNAMGGSEYRIVVHAKEDGTLSYDFSKYYSEFSFQGVSKHYIKTGESSLGVYCENVDINNLKIWLQAPGGEKYWATIQGDQSAAMWGTSFRLKLQFNLPETLEEGTKLKLFVQESGSSRSKVYEHSIEVSSKQSPVAVTFETMSDYDYNTRTGWVWGTSLSVDNESHVAVDAPLIMVTDSTDEFAMYYSYDDAKVRDRSSLIYLSGLDGSDATKFESTETSTYGVYVKNYRSQDGSVKAWVLTLDDATELSPLQWSRIESALQPASMSDAEWNAWWRNIKPRIGTTVSDFVAFVYDMRDMLLGQSMLVKASLSDIVTEVMKQFPDYVPSAGSCGFLRDSDGVGIEKAVVDLYLLENGERKLVHTTLTAADGYFCFGQMVEGALYELTCSSSFVVDGEKINSVSFVQTGNTTEHDWVTPVTSSVDVLVEGLTDDAQSLASVYLSDTAGNMIMLTRNGGKWSAENVETGDYILHVIAEGFHVDNVEIRVSADEANLYVTSANVLSTVSGCLLYSDGKSVASDQYVVLCDELNNVISMAQTDDKGEYLFEDVMAGRYVVRLNDVDGRVLSEVVVSGSKVQLEDSLLDKGHIVKGALRGAAVGCSVSLYDGDICRYTTTLSADNSYTFTGVSAGKYRLLVDSVEIDNSYVLILSEGESVAEVPELVALQGAHISGTVQGMEADFVALYKDGQMVSVANVAENGVFGFTVGQLGMYTIQAFNLQNGKGSNRMELAVGSLNQNYDVTLPAGQGRLQFSNGNSYSDDSIVILAYIDDSGEVLASVRKGINALRTGFSGLADGRYKITVKDGTQVYAQTIEISEDRQNISLELENGVEGYSLLLKLANDSALAVGETASVSIYHVESGNMVACVTVNSENGTSVDGFLPGSYTVCVRGDNGTTYVAYDIEIGNNKTEIMVVSPEKLSSTIRGHVIGVDDAFADDTRVMLLNEYGSVISTAVVNANGGYNISAQVDAKGCYLMFINTSTGQVYCTKVESSSNEVNVELPAVERNNYIDDIPQAQNAALLTSGLFNTFGLNDARSSEYSGFWGNQIKQAGKKLFNELAPKLVQNGLESECCDTSVLQSLMSAQWNAYTTAVNDQSQAAMQWRETKLSIVEFCGTVTAAVMAAKLAGGFAVGLSVGIFASTVVTTVVTIIRSIQDGDDLISAFENAKKGLDSIGLEIGKYLERRDVIKEFNRLAGEVEQLQKEIVHLHSIDFTEAGMSVEAWRARTIELGVAMSTKSRSLSSYVKHNPILADMVSTEQLASLNRLADFGYDIADIYSGYDPSVAVKSLKVVGMGESMRRGLSVLKLLDALDKLMIALSGVNVAMGIQDTKDAISRMKASMEKVQGLIEKTRSEYNRVASCISKNSKGCDPEPEDELPHKSFASFDPNDIYGPSGYGKENWIAPKEMQFQIVCENKPEENIAHAAMVTITQQIDSVFDYRTFRLGNMSIAGNVIEITDNVQSYRGRVDWTDTLGIWVDVNAWFDAETGKVTWEFIAIDPETGFVVSDPFTGLLAPNHNPPEGDGGVYYYVSLRDDVESGAEFSGQANIVFDYNEPILTPVISYTLDNTAPVAAMVANARRIDARRYAVSWLGVDEHSGISSYDVYVSRDGGEWELWAEDITQTSAVYTAESEAHEYRFRVVATDNVGNVQQTQLRSNGELLLAHDPAKAQPAVLRVETVTDPSTGYVTGFSAVFNVAMKLDAQLRNGSLASLVKLVHAQAGAADMAAGSFSYDSATHTLHWSSAAPLRAGDYRVEIQPGALKSSGGAALSAAAVPGFTVRHFMDAAEGTYSAPTLADVNGDGLVDLLVGVKTGDAAGAVRLHLNTGTAARPSFGAGQLIDTPYGVLSVDATGCQGAAPAVGDINGDGLADMFIGKADGTVQIYIQEQPGTAGGAPVWSDYGSLKGLDVGDRATPVVADWNADGRADLLVGNAEGNICLYLNVSANSVPSYAAGQYLYDGGSLLAVPTGRSSFVVGDWDGDGLADILSGNTEGQLVFYRNYGTEGAPLFAGYELLSVDGGLFDLPGDARSRLTATDWNGDGRLDLVVGSADGRLHLLLAKDVPMGEVGGFTVASHPNLDDSPAGSQELILSSAYDGSGIYTATVQDSLSATDRVDYFSITPAADGFCRVGIDAENLESAVRLSVGVMNENGAFEATQELLLVSGAATTELTGIGVSGYEHLYIKVEPVDASAGVEYQLQVDSTVPSAGSSMVTHNNTEAEATALALPDAEIRGWVGAGDACDFYRVEMASAGSLSISLDELEAAARIRIYAERGDGSLAQLQSSAVKANRGLDEVLELASGTYYVEIASFDGGAGRYNTGYSLTLEKEELDPGDEASASHVSTIG